METNLGLATVVYLPYDEDIKCDDLESYSSVSDVYKRQVYHHRKIDRKLFEKYRRRYHPYGSIASLYLWAVAGGALLDMKDYAPKNKK